MVGGQTLDLSAEQLDVDLDAGRAILSGRVHATLGDLVVNCPRVEVAYDTAPTVKWAKGTGGVEATLGSIAAVAQTVEVDVAAREVRLSGGVKLTRGRGWVEAASATIELVTHKVSLKDVRGSVPVAAPSR